MKLFKVTYKKLYSADGNVRWEEHQEYYLCNSLDRLYNYVEDEQYLTVLNIEILKHTLVQSKKNLNANAKQYDSLSEYSDASIIKAI